MFDFTMEHIFSYTAGLQPPQIIGPVPEGIRANWYITGGEVSGPKLRGRLRAEGADFFTLRPDGIAVVDVRTVIETHDGALIYVFYEGIGDLGIDGYDNLLRGELPPSLPLTTSPHMRCAHPDYQWVQRLHCVGVGAVDLRKFTVAYDVHAVRR